MEITSCLPLIMKELPETFMKKAEIELGETPEKREKCLIELRKLILEEKELSCRTDDEFLIMFLRSRKFDIDRAFATVKNLFKFKLEFHFFQRHPNISLFYDILEKRITTLLKYRDPEGRAIFVLRVRNWNTDEDTFDDMIAASVGQIYAALDFPMTQVNGIVVIYDLEGLNFNHFKSSPPRLIRIITHGIQDCVPIRLQNVHVLKESFLAKCLWMIYKPFLSKKLKNRVFFHGENMESLHQFVPPSILPPEYGGNLDMSDISEQCKETKYGEKVFLDIMNSGYIKEEQKLRNKLKE